MSKSTAVSVSAVSLVLSLAIVLASAAPVMAGVTVWEKDGKKLDLFGDVRIRLEQDSNQRDGKEDRTRDRNRVRMRIGGKFRANETVELGWRLATSANNLHSTNHDLAMIEGGKDERDFGLDRAYLKFDLKPAWIWLGRNENVVWDPTGLTWDPDLQGEGAAIGWNGGSDTEYWAALGYYMVNETYWDRKDDTMLAYQAGIKTKGGLGFEGAVGGYTFNAQDEDNPDGLPTPGGSATYLHAMAVVTANDMEFKPRLGAQYVASDVADGAIGTGVKSSDKQAYMAFIGGKAGMFKIQLGYWDVGYAGATAVGYFVADNFAYTSNYTGWHVKLTTKLFGALKTQLVYYDQTVKNDELAPIHEGDAQLGKGNKRQRIQLNLSVKF